MYEHMDCTQVFVRDANSDGCSHDQDCPDGHGCIDGECVKLGDPGPDSRKLAGAALLAGVGFVAYRRMG